MHLDHVTIRTLEIEITKNFLLNVFDLVVGERPASIAASIEGYWLYNGDWPLIHIIKSLDKYTTEHEKAEALDHFALVLPNYNLFKDRLMSKNIPFKEMHLPEVKRKRIILRTPSNVLIETIFEDKQISHGV